MTRPPSQHAWEATFGQDRQGRPRPPSRQLLALLSVTGAPDDRAAAALEAAMTDLERRHAHGPDGLLTTLGWGTLWWTEHTDLPTLINPPARMSRWEDPVIDTPHLVLHLASDHDDVLDEALAAVVDGDAGEHLVLDEVRRGFVGAGLPADALPHLAVHPDAPLLMGFASVHRGSQATEAAITIPSGPLAGGTTGHVSRIVLDVERWYAESEDRQAALMYAPTLTADQARALVDDAPSDYARYAETVREHGVVGHAQAAARARIGDAPVINRRDFATLDDGVPGTHFVSLQRELRDFNNTRAIMNAADGPDHHRGVGARRSNGINAFFDVTHRATVAIPPRSERSFPHRRRS